MENIEINEFSAINMARCIGPFNCGQKDNLYWITAMVEELGEIAGAVKKLERGFNEREFLKVQKLTENVDPLPSKIDLLETWKDLKRQSIAKEAADLFTYLNLFCQKNEIDLFKAVKEKFNQVSKEMGCPEFKI